jgi:hypothetical protein
MTDNRVKRFIIYLKEDWEYTRLNMPLAEAKTLYKHKVVGQKKWPWSEVPEIFVTIKKGTILYSQDGPFNDRLKTILKGGFSYQWGFGPCYEIIPVSHISVAEVVDINIEEQIR